MNLYDYGLTAIKVGKTKIESRLLFSQPWVLHGPDCRLMIYYHGALLCRVAMEELYVRHNETTWQLTAWYGGHELQRAIVSPGQDMRLKLIGALLSDIWLTRFYGAKLKQLQAMLK